MRLKSIGFLLMLMLSLVAIPSVLGSATTVPNVTSATVTCYTNAFDSTFTTDVGVNASISYGTENGVWNASSTEPTNGTTITLSNLNIVPNRLYYFNLTVTNFLNGTLTTVKNYSCTTYPVLTVTATAHCNDYNAYITLVSSAGSNASMLYGSDGSLGDGSASTTTNQTTINLGTSTRLSKDSKYFFNYTVWRFGDPYYYLGSSTNLNCTTWSSAIDSDALHGLPSVGSDIAGFLKNVVLGIGAFIIVLAVFYGLVRILQGVVATITDGIHQQ